MNEGALDQDRRAAYPNFLAHGRSSNAMSNIYTDMECGPILRKRVLNCSQIRMDAPCPFSTPRGKRG
ncbi:hypothetical protein Q6325_30780, partial [Klebsiella pneumoniae]|uniref:hypothetical protein n=1 Tax=Klebsiella pneumoniae TaxID=573 RepID=UPI002730306F